MGKLYIPLLWDVAVNGVCTLVTTIVLYVSELELELVTLCTFLELSVSVKLASGTKPFN